MVSSLVFIIIYCYTSIHDYGEVTIYNVFVVAIPLACVGYVFVLIESCYSNVMGHLRFQHNVESLEHYIQSLLHRKPTLVTVAEAYHMEARTRQVYQRDSNGNSHWTTETYYQKVVSWEGEDHFQFNYWQDLSDKHNIPKSYGELVRVRLTKNILFANDITETAFRTQQDAFVERNKHRDDNFKFWTKYEIAGFQDHVMYYDREKGLPCWMNWLCFAFFTFIGCSWPYRWLFFYRTKKTNYEITKVVSLNPISNKIERQAEVCCVQPIQGPPPLPSAPSYQIDIVAEDDQPSSDINESDEKRPLLSA